LSLCKGELFGLPVNFVSPAEFAEFFQFQTILHGPFILCGRIIPLFALRASQSNNITHDHPSK
jgi:hypothetical protein